MKQYYYIETLSHNHPFNEKANKIMFPANASEKDIFNAYMTLCQEKQFGHATLRHWNGWLHELIAEWFETDEIPYWYTNYSACKTFCSAAMYWPENN